MIDSCSCDYGAGICLRHRLGHDGISGRLVATLLTTTSVMLGTTGGTLTTNAGALPGVQVAGSAVSAAVHGRPTVVFTYTITVPVPIESVSFTTHQAAALPAALTGATLDRTVVPSAQISRPDSADITIQVGAAPTDGLAAGVHKITFTATATSGPAAETSSSATISWVRASLPRSQTSEAVAVAVNQPDLAGTGLERSNNAGPDSGPASSVGTGTQVAFFVLVGNLGFGAPHTALTITLPTGLVFSYAIRDEDAESGPRLSCPQIGSTPAQFSCALGILPHFTDGQNPACRSS